MTVTVKGKDGALSEVTKTLYRTEDGYVMDNPATLMGWTPISVFAMRDANGEHLRTLDSFLEMSKASSVKGLLDAQDRTGGIPWVNTIAADRAGNALYADHSVVPNVPDALVNRCITPIGLLTKQLAGLPVLDGTRARSDCAWQTDADASRPGILGTRNLPATIRRDWVSNANDSYWMPNDKQRLEGYAGIIGSERSERSLRTRMVNRYVTDALGKGRISHATLRGFQHQNRVYGAELAREKGDLDTLCRAADGGEACGVLKVWDGRSNTTSVGTHIFEEFIRRADSPWAVPFDPDDPVNTPRDLKETHSGTIKAMKDALAHLKAKGVPLAAPLGTLQVADKVGAEIPVGGGSHAAGNANVVGDSGLFNTSRALYRINYGSSHIQAVSFSSTGVKASTILTYGQSLDRTSPWSSDQTRMFGKKQWVAFPYTSTEVAKQKIRSTRLVVRR